MAKFVTRTHVDLTKTKAGDLKMEEQIASAYEGYDCYHAHFLKSPQSFDLSATTLSLHRNVLI